MLRCIHKKKWISGNHFYLIQERYHCCIDLYPFIVCSVRLALRKPWEKTQFWRPWCVCLSCVCVGTVLRTRVAGLIFQGDSYKLGPRTQSRNALRKGSVSIHGTLLQQDELGVRGSPCDLVFQQEQRGLAPPQHVRQSLLPLFPMFIHLAALALVFFTLTLETSTFLRILPCTFFCWAHM